MVPSIPLVLQLWPYWPNFELPNPIYLRLRLSLNQLCQLCGRWTVSKNSYPFESSSQVVVSVKIPQILFHFEVCVPLVPRLPHRGFAVFTHRSKLPGNPPLFVSTPLPCSSTISCCHLQNKYWYLNLYCRVHF